MERATNVAPSFRGEMSRLKERLLAMGGEAEEQVRQAVRALVDRDHQLAEQVLTGDESINTLQREVDDRCFRLLQQKEADDADLRVVISGLKINSDLERIGDFAVNIAQATFRYLQHPAVKPLVDIPNMAHIARGMLRDALNAYVRHDLDVAVDVLNRDDSVDRLKEQIFRDLLGFMLENPATTEALLELILISRHLERIADHTTNVAEDVIFMASGRDVRHHAQEGSSDA